MTVLWGVPLRNTNVRSSVARFPPGSGGRLFASSLQRVTFNISYASIEVSNNFTITPAAVTAGSMLILPLALGLDAGGGNVYGASYVISVTDTLGNHWNRAVRSGASTDGVTSTEIWYARNPTGGSVVIIVQVSNFICAAGVLEELAVNASVPGLSVQGFSVPSATTSPTGGSATTPNSGDLVYGVLAWPDSATVGTKPLTTDSADYSTLYDFASTGATFGTTQPVSVVSAGRTATLASGAYTPGWTTGSPISTAGCVAVFTETPAIPNAPTKLNGWVLPTSVSLSWVCNSNTQDGAADTGIKVYRSIDDVNFTLVATTAAHATSYLDTGLAPLTKYYYKVNSTNTHGDSADSNQFTPTTVSSTPPSVFVLSDFALCADGSNGQVVNGSAGHGGEIDYPMGYNTEGAMTWSVLGSGGAVESKCLQVTLTGPGGSGATEFYPHWLPNDNSVFYFARQMPGNITPGVSVTNPSWQNNTYNRIRCWVWVPPQQPDTGVDDQDIQFGTYCKSVVLDQANDEGGGNHYYYILSFFHSAAGMWHQINIMLFHPNHQRDNNAVNWFPVQYPTSGQLFIEGARFDHEGFGDPQSTYNMADCFTRCYIEDLSTMTSLPAAFRLDVLEFYQGDQTEPDDVIDNVVTAYNVATNELCARWNSLENVDVFHDVYYSFAPIRGNSAWTPPPNPPPPGTTVDGVTYAAAVRSQDSAYTYMIYRTTGISMGENTTIYLALVQRGDTRWCEIAHPLNIG